MGSQQFCLKWKSHYSNLLSALDQLLFSESFTDVTLACEGLSLKAHKAVLAACSPFFQSLFVENACQHPIVILKDFKYCELRAIVDFMYHGEVNVSREQLSSLLKAAEALQVKGLTELTGEDTTQLAEQSPSLTTSEVRPAEAGDVPAPCNKRPMKTAASSKRKRIRPRHVTPKEQEGDRSSSEETEQTRQDEGQGSGSHKAPSVLESLLSSKEPQEEPHEDDLEPSQLLHQALKGADLSHLDQAEGPDCQQKLFPASSQLSLLATAKMLESSGAAERPAEAASALLATLAAGESSSGSGSSQSKTALLF